MLSISRITGALALVALMGMSQLAMGTWAYWSMEPPASIDGNGSFSTNTSDQPTYDQWNVTNEWGTHMRDPLPVLSTERARSGSRSLKFVAADNGTGGDGYCDRMEYEQGYGEWTEGSEVSLAFSLYLEEINFQNAANDTDSWMCIGQYHYTDGGEPIMFSVITDRQGQAYLQAYCQSGGYVGASENSMVQYLPFTKLEDIKGKWIDLILSVKFCKTAENGFMKAYIKDASASEYSLAVDYRGNVGPGSQPHGGTLRWGFYRNKQNARSVIYIDELRCEPDIEDAKIPGSTLGTTVGNVIVMFDNAQFNRKNTKINAQQYNRNSYGKMAYGIVWGTASPFWLCDSAAAGFTTNTAYIDYTGGTSVTKVLGIQQDQCVKSIQVGKKAGTSGTVTVRLAAAGDSPVTQTISSDNTVYTINTGWTVAASCTVTVSCSPNPTYVRFDNLIYGGAGRGTPPPPPPPPPGNVLSLNKPATSDAEQTGNETSHANDGDLTATRWAAGDASYPHWWRVDLGSRQAITTFNSYFYNADSRYYQYTIATSDDDVTYTNRVDQSANTAMGNHVDDLNVTARYVKITFSYCSVSTGQAGAYEFLVMGAGGATSAAMTPQVGLVGPEMMVSADPSNSTVTIRLSGSLSGRAMEARQLRVYDGRGKLVADLSDALAKGNSAAGHYVWSVGNRPSGIYTFCLKTGTSVVTRRIAWGR